ncbi:MAG: Bifunctional NAD(P)H-hydrate repair enzyme Nnr [Phycisphaerae bacterium]|nr:Bifunctional NAD(P)H-hydrate repair enzyme Nnr [Phycisphaerae bacterium]
MAEVSSGSPRHAFELPRLPARAPETHKGEVGRVAVVAGSRDMPGAAILAARGALRGGAGLVRVFAPASAHAIVAAAEPCAMVSPLAEDGAGRIAFGALPALLEGLSWADVVALGPGLGTGEEQSRVVLGVLSCVQKPLVLDADGLNAVAEQPTWWSGRDAATILTPHPGEMARLRGGAGLVEIRPVDHATRVLVATEVARLTSAVTVLKGRHTVVCDGRSTYANSSGNSGMATGGMGDVLTGLIAALVGQGLGAFQAACLGVCVHGQAADLVAETSGPVGYLARDVAEALPRALRGHIKAGDGR